MLFRQCSTPVVRRAAALVLALGFLLVAQTLQAASGQVVAVGVHEAPPKISFDAYGHPTGIYVELLDEIARQEGWRLQYVVGSWSDNLDRLERGEIDLVADIALTTERKQHYAFPRVPVLSSWFQVFASKRQNIHSLRELDGKRILVLERSVQEQAFTRLAERFGLNPILLSVPDYPTMFAMIANGEADAIITNRYQGKWGARQYGLDDTEVLFEPNALYYAAAKGDPKHLLPAIDRHLVAWKEDQDSLYYAALKRLADESDVSPLSPWLMIAGGGLLGFLLVSIAIGVFLKHRVNVRTQELQQENAERRALQQRFMDIIEFLPDPTFVVDEHKRVIAWNQACEVMTGVKKEQVMGQGDYVYAEAFFGHRRPSLVDLLDQPDPPAETSYTQLHRSENRIYAETFFSSPLTGQTRYLWAVASPLYDQDGRRSGAIEAIRDISEQRNMADAVRASEREYRELVTLANSIIVRWQPDGRLTFLNEFGQRFFGYGASELIGRHVIGTLVPEVGSDGRDLKGMMEELTRAPHRFERSLNENMRRNGERVWVDWTNKVVTDAKGEMREILSIGSDITERIQAEEQIRLLNEDLRRHAETLEQRVAERTAELAAINEEQRAIFESASAGILLTKKRIIQRCNRKLEAMAGYDPGELIGQSARILYPDEAVYAHFGREMSVRLASGETCSLEQRLVRKDGSQFWARLSMCASDTHAPFKGVVGIIEDITAEREATEQLRQALEAAQEADRVKTIFLASMSHELRTPLNSIIGFTGILSQGLAGPLNPEQHKQLGMVQKSARHLLALINDVLDISKINAGQLELVEREFALRPSIEKTVKLIAPLAEEKGVELRVDIAEEVGKIVTDQRRLEQVMLNLLNNAIKFTEQGWVSMACRQEGDGYLLTVTDSGIGMRADELPRLFKPFYQVDSGLARKHEGSGLGLSICKKIVEMMGGDIGVASEWGQGSTFTVRLPGRNQEETA
ncbi:PAS domain S-box protein [Desulfobulbus sp.]|uniref:PAS domain S-box protein n=1 Tax=Desulfobulbus sp. TaxID=895 RepID=UPI00286FAAE8|nr:PAS domain S-box protein [Desulfobulbus sp.]